MRLAALAISLMLAACAAPHWTKPGASPEQAAADYSECEATSQQASRRDNAIESDILASRGHDWEKSGTMAAHEEVFAAEAYHRTDDVIRFCMEAKGYAAADAAK